MEAVAPRSGRSRWVSLAAALLVGAGAFALLARFNPTPPSTDDAVRDLLFARDCLELHLCHSAGASTSVPGFFQGAAWIDLVTAVRAFGGTPGQLLIVVLLLDALGVATLFLTVARWLEARWALPAALFALTVLLVDDSVGQLVNPSAVFLLDALCACLIAVAVKTRRDAPLLGAAFAAGVAMNFHVAAAALPFSVLILALLLSARPGRTLAAATGLLALAALSTSVSAWVLNATALRRDHMVMPALAILVLGLVAAMLGRAAVGRLSDGARLATAGAALALPYIAGAIWISFGLHHWLGVTYVYPILAPAAVFAAGLLDFVSLRRWYVGVPAAGMLCVGALRHLPPETARRFRSHAPLPGWTFTDEARIGRWLHARGWSYDQILYRTESVGCRELVAGLAVDLPAPGPEPIDPGRALQVRVDRERATGPDALPLANGETAHLSSVRSWLRPDALVVCRAPVNGRPACTHDLAHIPPGLSDTRRFAFTSRSFPGFAVFDAPGAYVARYEIPIAADATGARDVTIPGAGESCDWQIVSVSGATAETPLPATHVRLRASGHAGVLGVQRAIGTAPCFSRMDRQYPPCLMEEDVP